MYRFTCRSDGSLLQWQSIQAKKFLKHDWLRQVVFQPNLKYLHVKITVSVVTEMTVFSFETMLERFLECDKKELQELKENMENDNTKEGPVMITQKEDRCRTF